MGTTIFFGGDGRGFGGELGAVGGVGRGLGSRLAALGNVGRGFGDRLDALGGVGLGRGDSLGGLGSSFADPDASVKKFNRFYLFLKNCRRRTHCLPFI